jgi:hypothetical protein
MGNLHTTISSEEIFDVENQLLQRAHKLEQPRSFSRDTCMLVRGESVMPIQSANALDVAQETMRSDSLESAWKVFRVLLSYRKWSLAMVFVFDHPVTQPEPGDWRERKHDRMASPVVIVTPRVTPSIVLAVH